MKSLYQNETLAEYWNKRAGNEGEIYKRLILDPIMFKLVGSFEGKTILDLGCGNGYLVKQFLLQNPKKVILMDISEYNLAFAREKTSDHRIVFTQHDATQPWPIKDNTMDIIYSNMMLNEIEDIKTPIQEAYRVLKRRGKFIFSVTHPSWNLYIFAQEQAGVSATKVKGLGGYFRRGYAKYIMGANSKTAPELSKYYKKEFEVEHYQRPLSDYFNTLISTGFEVKKIIEPELTSRLLKENPRFSDAKDYPIGLVFLSDKSDTLT